MAYDLTPRVGDSAHRLLFKIAAATSDVADPPNPDAPENQLLRRIAAATAAGAEGGVAFEDITGAPTDNSALAAALAAKAAIPTATTLTYAASVALDFAGADFQTVTLTGVIEFTTTNLAAGRSKTIRIVGDSSERALTFPAGWKFVGAAAPTVLAANKTAVLTMTSFSTTDANVVAAYSAEP